MGKLITIDSLSGTPNFNIWVSESCSNPERQFIATIDRGDLPYNFELPNSFNDLDSMIEYFTI